MHELNRHSQVQKGRETAGCWGGGGWKKAIRLFSNCVVIVSTKLPKLSQHPALEIPLPLFIYFFSVISSCYGLLAGKFQVKVFQKPINGI